ncbi:hypothetical protein BVG98_07470 [Lacticaseibacillus rhamnosus]|nr:hypothetical protein BVG98_07470 [Lacticaseibacillus rhamnosus]
MNTYFQNKQESGIDVHCIGVETFRGENKYPKFVIYLLRGLVAFFPHNIRVFFQCIIVVFQSWRKKHDLRQFRESCIASLYILYLFNEYRHADSTCITICDEGYVQALSSLSFQAEVDPASLSRLFEILVAETPQVHFLNCRLNEDIAYGRIVRRNRHDYSIDSLSGDELRNFLKMYRKILNTVRKFTTGHESIDCDMTFDTERLIREIDRRVSY